MSEGLALVSAAEILTWDNLNEVNNMVKKNNDEEIKINDEQEIIMMKAEIDRLRNLSGNRLLILRRLEQYANDTNTLLTNLRSDFAEVQPPVDEPQQGEKIE